MCKRALCLIFAFVLSIESFAAIVSDNDGSAFITKAEFDSLKNDFQSQLDFYNTSIDNKIDSAISSYLAGIKVIDEPVNYWDDISKATKGKFHFKNYLDNTYLDTIQSGIDSFSTEFLVDINREIYAYEWKNPYWNFAFLHRSSSNQGVMFINLSTTAWRGRTTSSAVDGTNSSARQHIFHQETAWGMRERWRYAYELNNPTIQAGSDLFTAGNTYQMIYGYNTYRSNKKINLSGKGAAFVIHKDGLGRKFLRECDNKLVMIYNLVAIAHSYKNLSGTNSTQIYNIYCVTDGQDDNTSFNIDVDYIPILGKSVSFGTEPSEGSQYKGDATWGEHKATMLRSTDAVDYTMCQFGAPGEINVVAIDDTFPYRFSAKQSISANETKTVRKVIRYSSSGPTSEDADMSGISASYYIPQLNYYSAKLSDFDQEQLTYLNNLSIKFGGGVKIAKANRDGDDIKLQIKFKSNITGVVPVNYIISNKQFYQGDFDSDGIDLIDGTKTYKTVNSGEALTIDLKNLDPNSEIWLNCYADGIAADIGIDELIVKNA